MNVNELRALVTAINPFWAMIVANTRVKIDDSPLNTSFTDGKNIVLHKPQIENEKKALQILLHELTHIAYLHVLRRKDYVDSEGNLIPPEVANIGEDVVANAIVVDVTGENIDDAMVVVPEGSRSTKVIIRFVDGNEEITFPRLIGEMTTEEIVRIVYEELKKRGRVVEVASSTDAEANGKGRRGQCQGQGSGQGQGQGQRKTLQGKGWRDDHSKHGELSDADKDEIRGTVKKAIEEWKAWIKDRGTIPFGLEEEIERAKPRIVMDWRRYMRKWLWENIGMDDYTWKRPNKRKMAATRIYLPRTIGRGGEVFVVLDTSGSMRTEELAEALGIIQASMVRSGIEYVTLIHTDADVEKVERISVQRLNRVRVKGRGGTVLQKGLEEARQRKAKAAIVITDGYIDELDFDGKLLVVVVGDGCENAKRNVKRGEVVCVTAERY